MRQTSEVRAAGVGQRQNYYWLTYKKAQENPAGVNTTCMGTVVNLAAEEEKQTEKQLIKEGERAAGASGGREVPDESRRDLLPLQWSLITTALHSTDDS